LNDDIDTRSVASDAYELAPPSFGV